MSAIRFESAAPALASIILGTTRPQNVMQPTKTVLGHLWHRFGEAGANCAATPGRLIAVTVAKTEER